VGKGEEIELWNRRNMIHDVIYRALVGLFNICVFRSTPAALPYSKILLGTLIVIELLLKTVGFSSQGAPLPEALSAALAYLGILIAVLYGLLRYRHTVVRLHKLLIALLGTELLLTALLQLLLRGFYSVGNIVNLEVMGSLIIVSFFIWILAIKARVLKATLEINMVAAILLTIGIYIISSIPILLMLGQYLQPSESG